MTKLWKEPYRDRTLKVLLISVIAFTALCFICKIPVGWYSFFVPWAGIVLYTGLRDRLLFYAVLADTALLIIWCLAAWISNNTAFGMIAVLKTAWMPLTAFCPKGMIAVFLEAVRVVRLLLVLDMFGTTFDTIQKKD